MATITLTRLSSGQVKIQHPLYPNPRIVPSDGWESFVEGTVINWRRPGYDPIPIDTNGNTIIENGNTASGSAIAIAEVLATTTFFKSSGGLTELYVDETLSGDGSQESPLSVIKTQDYTQPLSGFQPHLGNKRVMLIEPVEGSTSITYLGHGALAESGTKGQRTKASTNFLTQSRRIGWVSSASAGSIAGARSGDRVWIGNAAGLGGFYYRKKFGIVLTATGYLFYEGLIAGTGAIGATTLPSALTDIIGVGFEQGTDTNFQFLHNDSSGTATKIDTGIAPSTTTAYAFSIYCAPNASSVTLRLTNLATGATFSSSPSTNLPSNSTFLIHNLHISNNATASSVTVDMLQTYIEI